MQKTNSDIKQTNTSDKVLLKKSSLNIPLLAETEEDKRIAHLLSKKLSSSKSIAENTELARKKIICSSSLPCSFTTGQEKKAIRLLNKNISKTIGIRKLGKNSENLNKNVKEQNSNDETNEDSSKDLTEIKTDKKIKLSQPLVAYESSSDTD